MRHTLREPKGTLLGKALNATNNEGGNGGVQFKRGNVPVCGRQRGTLPRKGANGTLRFRTAYLLGYEKFGRGGGEEEEEEEQRQQ